MRADWSVVVDTSYYELLEISVDADDVEIKRAYKRQAMRHHPVCHSVVVSSPH